jgi:bud emergence protein 1
MTQHSQIQPDGLLAAVYATVDKWTYENDRYWYIVNAVMENGQLRSLCRNYEDFYDLQIALLQEFPDEAGQGPSQQTRTLPFMPGPVAFVNASISSSRRASLDQYLKKLLELPAYISRSPIVKRLFVLRPGDIERPAQANQDYENYGNERQSQVSQHSYDSQGDPIPSSGYGRDLQYCSMSSQNGHIRSTSDLQPPQLGRHDSSISQTTQSSAQQFIKVKISYQNEIIAIRLPRDVSFSQLQEKLQDRLGADIGSIQYKDEPSNSYINLGSDSDLNTALSRNSKLVLYAT